MKTRPKTSSHLAVHAMSALIAGCSIAAGMDENKRTEERIGTKEGTLRSETVRGESLQAEQAQLKKDLATRQLSLDDINRQLDRIREANAKSVATSREQIARKQAIERQIAQHKSEIDSLKGQGQLSDDEKRRRIAKLKADIDEELKVQLAL